VRVSIRVIRNLDGATVHERVVDVGEDRRVGSYVDEVLGSVWTDETTTTAEYKLTIEVAE
jgi:hypothetical protein